MINEIDENEESGPVLLNKQKSAVASTSVIREKQATREYMKTFSLPKRPPLPSVASIVNKENKVSNSQKPVEEVYKSPPRIEVQEEELNECTVDESTDFQDSVFDDDFDMTLLENVEEKEESLVKTAITEEQLLNGWETMQQGVENATQNTVIVNAEELPVVENDEGKQVTKWLFLLMETFLLAHSHTLFTSVTLFF